MDRIYQSLTAQQRAVACKPQDLAIKDGCLSRERDKSSEYHRPSPIIAEYHEVSGKEPLQYCAFRSFNDFPQAVRPYLLLTFLSSD